MRTYEDALRDQLREAISSQLQNAASIGALALKQLLLAAMTWIDLMSVPDTETPIDLGKTERDAKGMN